MRIWCFAVALLLAGCTDDGGASQDPPSEDPGPEDPGSDNETVEPAPENETPENETPEPRAPVTWTVAIEGNDFVDGSITVQAGDTVRWEHQDGTTPHTVTSDDGAFTSGSCPGPQCMTEFTNDVFEEVFDDVGEFGYFCEVHPSMTDTITVLQTFDGTP